MATQRTEGLVIRMTGGEVWVNVGGTTIPCHLRGRFRQKDRGLRVVAGDRVVVTPPDASGEQGAIEGLLVRKTWLSRYAGGREETEKVIVANIDILVIVISARSPRVNLGFLDRMLVSAERGHNDIRLCLNKIDLLPSPDDADTLLALYENLGYPVLKTSAKSGEGLNDLRGLFEGGIYAFVGQSGVGKSSILNAIDEELKLKVRQVARKTGRGRHTTTNSQLFPVAGGYVADTPGMQTFGFPGADKAELPLCYREFRRFAEDCRFQPCSHSHEPGCAVKDALDGGLIAPSRYRSYQAILGEVASREKKRY
jgi:ribosome biogenesis GTPase